MDLGQLTLLDFVFLAVIGLSVLRGFTQGAVREIAGVGGWVVAFAVAFLFASDIRPYMPEIGVFGDFADACLISAFLAFLGLFVLSMIGVSLISPALGRGAGDAFGSGDRVVGVLFGLLRGFVIIVGSYLLYDVFVPDTDKSDLLTSATSYDLLRGLSETLRESAAGSLPNWLGGRIEALVVGCEGYLPGLPAI